MAKVHTRAKRRLKVGTHRGSGKINGPKKKGAKTFKTEKDAQKYASENGIVSYELKSVKKEKKFQIIEKG
ncbi:hypothetical protein K8R33_03820 [archaeon]|nr:hypothetical protein [archaeon]